MAKLPIVPSVSSLPALLSALTKYYYVLSSVYLQTPDCMRRLHYDVCQVSALT